MTCTLNESHMLHILKCENSLRIGFTLIVFTTTYCDVSNKNLVSVIAITSNTWLCSLLELQSLEQQLEEAQTENFNIKQMKDLFEQKAAQLATEIAGTVNLNFLASKYIFHHYMP